MATEKQIASRLIQKHDTEAHWNLATNFIPKQGEIIIYDVDNQYDYERFKIGDGITNVNKLPFTLHTITNSDVVAALGFNASYNASTNTVTFS